MTRKPYDAIVIGARCAGSATALQLARAGARILLVDSDPEPHDTLSTHALMRPAVALLRNWGLLGEIAATTPAVRETHFIYGTERITIPTKPAPGMAGLYAPRRWVLDRILREAACAAGAELRLGTRCTGVVLDGRDRVIGAKLRGPSGRVDAVRAELVIGADGRRSSVADFVQAPYLAQSAQRTAVCYAYLDGIPNAGYRWYYSPQHYAGLIPTTHGQHCLFAGGPPARFQDSFGRDALAGLFDLLSIWEPDLAEALRGRGAAERVRRFAGAPGHIRQCTGPGWALVGDAGYFKDPATAHGITDAFLDAQRLSDAVIAGSPERRSYAMARDPSAQRFFALTQKKAAFTHSMAGLKALHMKINDCMRAELAEVNAARATEKTAA